MLKLFQIKIFSIFYIILWALIIILNTGISHAGSIVFNQISSKKLPLNKKIDSIAIDGDGFVWLASGARLWRYDGYDLKSFDFVLTKGVKKIKRIYFDSSNTLWIGTANSGLLKYKNKTTSFLFDQSRHSMSSNLVSAFCSGDNGSLWIGTDNGLNFLSSSDEFSHFPYIDEAGTNIDLYITSILDFSDQELLIGTKKSLFLFNKQHHTYKKIKLFANKDNFIVFNIYQDFNKGIWVATQKGVFLKKYNHRNFVQYMPDLLNHSIPAIIVDKDNIWAGSFSEGLYKISRKNSDIEHYSYMQNNSASLSNNSIISMVASDNSILWINTFSGGINYFNRDALTFGMENNSKGSVYCSISPSFNDFDQDSKNQLWISSPNALLKFNDSKGECTKFNLDIANKNTFKHKSLRSTTLTVDGDMWLATTHGLNKFNPVSGYIDTSYENYINEDVLFVYEKNPEELLIATMKGLYVYNLDKQIVNHVIVAQQHLKKAKFYSYAENNHGDIYFATNAGVLILDQKQQLSIYLKIQNQLPTKEIFSIYLDKAQNLWVGTILNGLFRFNHKGDLIYHYAGNNLTENDSIYSIIADNQQNLWIGTDNGLIKLDVKTNRAHLFHRSDGLQGDNFNLNAVYKYPDGKLYFGGRNGFNAFYPEYIKINDTPPNIVLTDFTRFGKSVEIGTEQDGFLLEKSINELAELTLSHKDYVIGFEFAALDFSDPSRNKYAYMMEEQDPGWTYVDADNRRISYSNLKAGEYTFRVKGSNKDGVWNEVGKSLNIVVKPAPWFSWWAYAIYIVSGYNLISWYFRSKNAEYDKLTDILKFEVERQTKELKIQKKKVEDLLARKNELFVNVSHEFRTPLTLILGPVNKLLKSHLPATDIMALKMVNRNANRLLTMIEQLLQLAKISDNVNINFTQLKTKLPVETIVESFKPLAAEKKIDLQLTKNDEAAISSSKDAIEIILGNLLSNAIKYTPEGGSISVSSFINDNKVNIAVIDTGCGLDDKQQKDIFNRFKRLDAHHNIEGIGIGLSVVEELLKVNNAIIHIKSRPGEGSTFTVTFDCISMDFTQTDVPSDSLLLKQLTSEPNETTINKFQQQSLGMQNKESILIIEDNNDMRAHIADTLKNYYHCLLASGGNEGIALAIKHVPDIIICDVMMPGMDGFHVCRVMRSDTRTSHIPLVLLTALEDRESRIRGWREHVDVYLTKPFDAQELLLQLENILVIRNILKKKMGQMVKTGESAENSDLPKKDQQFIDKLNILIIKKYQDPLFLRPQMASDMAVSERQLQRKLKALIDKNPMDLLREYRLSQAATMLKDGYQVSITSDNCGFNSVTYFSQCFKAQFGMAPKVYQQTCQ